MGNSTISLTGPQADVDLIVKTLAESARRKHRRGYPEVCWDFESVQPAAFEYLTRDSYLYVNAYSQAGGTTMTIGAKILLPDGKIVPMQWVVPVLTVGSASYGPYPLVEGFLLSLTLQVYNPTTALQSGTIYVEAGLQFGATAAAVNYRVLLQGYATSMARLNWPDGTQTPQGAVQGFITQGSVGNPAAGADWSYAVGVGTRTWIHSVTAILTTAVAAANRQPQFTLQDPTGTTIWSLAGIAAQTASQVCQYNLGEALTLAQDVNKNFTISMPSEIYVTGAFKLFVTTTNIQAADQWSGISIQYESWPLF